MSQSKMLAYLAIGLTFLGTMACLFGGNGVLALIGGVVAGLSSILSILFMRYGYIVVPMLTQFGKVVIMTDTGYEIPSTQDVIVKNKEGLYYASVFLGIRVYESATEKTNEENLAYNEYFERAISSLKYVVKIAYMLYVEDITEKRRTIEAKRAEAQLRLARERERQEPDVLKIDRYDKEVNTWDVQLAKLTKGVKPMGVLAYAMTTAVDASKEGAIVSAKAQAKELRTTLANTLNVEVDWLTADEMMRCFEWEKFFPGTIQDIEANLS